MSKKFLTHNFLFVHSSQDNVFISLPNYKYEACKMNYWRRLEWSKIETLRLYLQYMRCYCCNFPYCSKVQDSMENKLSTINLHQINLFEDVKCEDEIKWIALILHQICMGNFNYCDYNLLAALSILI